MHYHNALWIPSIMHMEYIYLYNYSLKFCAPFTKALGAVFVPSILMLTLSRCSMHIHCVN